MWGQRLGAAILKELRQFVRDPVLLGLVLWLYTVEVAICAYALTFDLKNEAIAVLDQDHSVASLAMADRFERSPSFHVVARPASLESARRMLEGGSARLVVVIPPGYQREAARGDGADVQLLVDGANSMTGRTTLGQAEVLVLRDVESAAPAAVAALPRIDNRIRVRYNPDLRFVYFILLSMLGIGAYMVGVIHPAASIVKEKASGTMEQLLVTPLRPREIILAKTLPTFLVALLSFAPGLLVARAFGLHLEGDPVAFLAATIAFLVSAIATGVLIGGLTSTLQQTLLVTFFVLFPVLFISGTLTPIESMPRVLQLASRLSPLRYYMQALLGVFMKGQGTGDLLRPIAWMLGLGVLLSGVAAVPLRRSLG